MLIGNNKVIPPLIMAPMAGVTHVVFRRLMAQHGAAMVVSEMISAEGLSRKDSTTLRYVTVDSSVKAIQLFQLFGSTSEAFREAVKIMEDLGAQGIDINAGCPVPKVTRKGAGAALLKTPSLLYKIVETVKKTTSLPVTVKLRLGWDSNSINILNVAQELEKLDIDAITVHARTAKQVYTGMALWAWIGRLKSRIKIPIIGNGDVRSIQDMVRLKEETGCDAIMIGRGALGNPWIFQTGAAYLHPNDFFMPRDDWTIFYETVRSYIRTLNEREHHLPFLRSPGIICKSLIWFSRGCPGASQFRHIVTKTQSVEEMLTLFDSWFHNVILRSDKSFLEAKNLKIGE